MKNINDPMPYAIFSYVHHNRKIASLVTIRCKTDFALRTDLIKDLGKKISMHVVASGKFDLEDTWILNDSLKVKDVISDIQDQLGEPVIVDDVHISGN